MESPTDAPVRVSAVLPAAGCGERVGLPTPKQFCRVLGRPLISYTLEAFERVPWIEHVVVVVSPGKHHELEAILEEFGHTKVGLTLGHSTRHRSIFAGVQELGKYGEDPDVVIIHDAVRPFVDAATLRQVADEAHLHGAAGVIRPLASTVIGTDLEGFLEQSLDRSKFKASEMPQAFKYEIIRTAYTKCTDYDLDYGTECLHLVQKYTGTPVRLLDGPTHLWKVTHKRDLYAAEGMIKEHYNKVGVVGANISAPLCESMKKACSASSLDVAFLSSRDTLRSEGCTSCVLFTRAGEALEGVEQAALELPVNRRHAGGIVVVSREDTSHFRCFVRKLASRLQSSGRCVNGVIVEGANEAGEQAWPPLADIVADLLFNRNLTFTGQTVTASWNGTLIYETVH